MRKRHKGFCRFVKELDGRKASDGHIDRPIEVGDTVLVKSLEASSIALGRPDVEVGETHQVYSIRERGDTLMYSLNLSNLGCWCLEEDLELVG